MKKWYTVGASALLFILTIYTTNMYAGSKDTAGLSEVALPSESPSVLADIQVKSEENNVAAENTATPEVEQKATPKPTSTATPQTKSKVAAKATTTPKATTKATPKTTPKATTTSAPVSSKATAIINTAKSYLGVPYVWGGTSPSGFDCSGFISYVYGKNGITLPRVTSDQYNAGSGVSKANLKPGDLVFFETYKAGPSHVGIYLGNNEFIHASSGSGKVIISSLTSSYYTEHYIGSRRVL